MITELRIADLGVIKDATIVLHPGLTVVTGETGAGKTMIVSGLGLLLGGRADPRSVRRGSERARVEGRFRIENPELLRRVSEAGGEMDDDELILARHVTAGGRSRAYLGGAQVPASACAELTAELVAIYGQAEQERLTEADRQRQHLDRFAGAAVLEPLARYSALWSEERAGRTELAELRAEAQSRAREIDLLTFGLGRSLDYRDMPTVRRIVRQAGANNYRFKSFVLGIVSSDAFRKREVELGDPALRTASK